MDIRFAEAASDVSASVASDDDTDQEQEDLPDTHHKKSLSSYYYLNGQFLLTMILVRHFFISVAIEAL